eukprot:TRINITY_DN11689_c0_g1_i1.p1 TRINITY_DN11689_c0_g1~~TRINITY_DN11689_c0_g1_i1.p1  ORF type:complete len:125 (+),score=3.85 TRINITY_DN11689_c0_g1_i1:24-377(+)
MNGLSDPYCVVKVGDMEELRNELPTRQAEKKNGEDKEYAISIVDILQKMQRDSDKTTSFLSRLPNILLDEIRPRIVCIFAHVYNSNHTRTAKSCLGPKFQSQSPEISRQCYRPIYGL